MASIKSKVVLVVIVCLLLCAGAVTYLFNLSYQNNIQLLARDSLKSSIGAFNNLLKAETKKNSAIMEWIMDNDTYRKLFAARDRDNLMKWNEPIFKRFKKEYEITNWTQIYPDGTGFFRIQTPDLTGDKIIRYVFVESQKTKTWVAGLDLGRNGFALRICAPVYDQSKIGNLSKGNLIGYLELGTNIDRFVDIMKKQTTDDYGLVIKKKALDPEKWRLTRQRINLRNNWDDQKDIVIASNTTNDESIFKYDGDISKIPDAGQVLEIIHKGSNTYVRSVFPVKTAAGNNMAAMFVLRNITPSYNYMKAMQTKAAIFIIILMLLISATMILIFDKLIIKRLQNIVNIATRVVGGDYETQIVPSSNDEIGKFESLFEQVRLVFVNIINELEEKIKELEKK